MSRFDAIKPTGAHKGRPTELHADNPSDIISGIDMLRQISAGDHAKIGNRVIIIGGGNTAIDVARSVLRLGRNPVILYRRGIEDMPAFAKDVREALRHMVQDETRGKVILTLGDSV